MIDDRWSEDAEELGTALRRVLERHSSPENVRAIEGGDATATADLVRAVAEFGLWELTGEAELLVRASQEIGAALTPSPFVSAVPALALLGRADVADGVDRELATAGLPLVAVRHDDDKVALRPADVTVRSSAGELVHDLRQAHDAELIVTDADPIAWLSWGWLATSAALVGAADALLRYTVSYVSQRRQFGQPVGAFQGVAFPLADAATAVRGADLFVRKTTYLTATGATPPTHFAAMTAHTARDAARQAAAAAHQAMGGQGFTLEADTQLYSRRLRAWSAAIPDPAPTLAWLARTLADPDTRATVTDLWQFDNGFEIPAWAREAEDARS